MAWKLKYRCKGCGYEAEVYEGRGLFRQEITAMTCPDCKTIQNIVVGGYHRRRGPFVQERGGASVPELRQRSHQDLGQEDLPEV